MYMQRLQVRSGNDTKQRNRQNVEASRVLTGVVGGEAVANEGGGSVQQQGEDDTVDVVGQGCTKSSNTG